MKEIFCIVRGRVQLVMYRDFVCRKGRSFGLHGYVKNCPDGTVEVLAQGGEAHLRKFIDQLYKGSLLSHVKEVEVQWRELSKPHGNFEIQF